jgi:cation diffusion facilitator family transporter
MNPEAAHAEKTAAALSSVWLAAFLSSLDLAVGFWSGSLGILAEAVHSAFDLVAVLATYFAVRIGGKPPDPGHLYGHGKVEHLSALFQTLLLLGTCAWIGTEAMGRLAGKSVRVNASFWTFLAMAVSIAVDTSRSRRLRRVAAQHRSQALEADAMHFRSHIWSSAAVVLGLVGVRAAAFPPLAFLEKADAVAALLVAALVVFVSARLGLRTIEGLMDASPSGAADQIKRRVEAIPQVLDCHAIRVRHSGPRYFVDLHITLDGGLPLRDAHALTERVEQVVADLLPDADVTVHPEPTNSPEQTSSPGPSSASA